MKRVTNVVMMISRLVFSAMIAASAVLLYLSILSEAQVNNGKLMCFKWREESFWRNLHKNKNIIENVKSIACRGKKFRGTILLKLDSTNLEFAVLSDNIFSGTIPSQLAN